MRKMKAILFVGVAVLCLGAWTMEAGAGPNCGASASAEKASCSSSSAKAELTSGSACSVKGSMAHMFKQAPGTKASFQKIDKGVVLTVSAASAEYVPVVQKAVMTEIESMSTIATSQCAVSSAKAAESSSFARTASVEKAGSTCSSSKASVEKASTEKAGAGCCASKTASKASIEKASAGNCPDWMKVLCGADCVVENTADGIRITWTTDKIDALTPLQAAGEQFHAEVSRL